MRNHPWTPPARTPRPWGQRTLVGTPRSARGHAVRIGAHVLPRSPSAHLWQLLLAVVFTGVIAAAGRINVRPIGASVRVFWHCSFSAAC